jgi:hypothetical protein
MSFKSFLVRWLDAKEWPWMPPRWWQGEACEREVWRLRVLARRRMRGELVQWQGWGPTLVQAAVWPVWAPLKAGLYLRKHAPAGRSWAGAFVEMTWLQLAYNFSIMAQQNDRLALAGWRRGRRRQLVCREQQALLRTAQDLVAGYPDIGRKAPFARFCREHGLPAAEVLCEGVGGRVTVAGGEWPAQDLFFKPEAMGQGRGMEVLRHDAAAGCWRTAEGDAITRETVAAHAVRRLGADEPWMVQPRLVNAPSWAVFTRGGLCTCRVITGRVGPGDEGVRVLAVYLRMPCGDTVVDNLCAGGVGAVMDPASGRLGAGLQWKGRAEAFLAHPDTGARIEGVLLEGATEMRELALRAHRAAGGWCSVGWDISLTTRGLVIIEANVQWAATSLLDCAGGGFVEVMKMVFGERFEKFPERFHG